MTITLPKGSLPTSSNVSYAIESNEKIETAYNKLDDYYKGFQKILNRTRPSSDINNKVVVNHSKYIVDINVGYLLGSPVDYRLIGEDIAGYEKSFNAIKNLYRGAHISNIDHEIAKNVGIFGIQYEYTFINEDAQIRTVDIDNRGCCMVYDDTVEHRPLFAVMYQRVRKGEYKNVIAITKDLEIGFDSKIQDIISERKHIFGVVPVVEYKNNTEFQGDFEQIIPLIDAYNLLMSDRVNDKEQLVSSLLLFFGVTLTPEQASDLKVNRVLAIPEAGADAKYISKMLDEIQVEVLRNAIIEDIHKISMTPNLSDTEFVGNSSGVAIRFKLVAFDQMITNKERYFEQGLLKRFELYNRYISIKNGSVLIPMEYVDVIFKRNLPQNDYETSQMINNLTDYLTKKTAISQLSFIKDADEELLALGKETRIEEVPEFGTPRPTSLSDVELKEEINKLIS